jgi:hypothetical protein
VIGLRAAGRGYGRRTRSKGGRWLADASAIAPNDYVAEKGKLTFKPGDLAQKVTIDVRGDAHPEADESFRVDLSNPTNASLADRLGIGTVVDDDALYAP